jgi:hypothetical protein
MPRDKIILRLKGRKSKGSDRPVPLAKGERFPTKCAGFDNRFHSHAYCMDGGTLLPISKPPKGIPPARKTCLPAVQRFASVPLLRGVRRRDATPTRSLKI